MRNEVVIDQIISFHKPNKKSKEWEYNGLNYFSDQTPYKGWFGAKGSQGGGIPLLFKIELQGDFSPMNPLGIPYHQISPKGAHYHLSLTCGLWPSTKPAQSNSWCNAMACDLWSSKSRSQSQVQKMLLILSTQDCPFFPFPLLLAYWECKCMRTLCPLRG
jgi:hypothetical protein